MEEIVTYVGQGLADDKHGESSVGHSISVHSNTVSFAYKFANAHSNGVVSTGFLSSSDNDKVFVAVKNKALIHVYAHGKEAPIQKIPVPEQLSSLALSNGSQELVNNNIDQYNTRLNNTLQLPWLLVGGSITGKLYIWELSSGNLIYNKSVHYQKFNKIAFSNNNHFLVTCSEDSRVLVFRTLDLVSNIANGNINAKPAYTITDHTLPVTDLHVTSGINSDIKLITVCQDSTCRIYDLNDLKLIFTLVLNHPIYSLAVDPAFRVLYLGLEDGSIREVKLYQIDTNTRKLYHIVDKPTNKIYTLQDDSDLKFSFITHQQTEQSKNNNVKITALDLSFDGTLLISGDSTGTVIVSDILTKQTLKSFKTVNGAISYLKLFVGLSKDQQGSTNLLGNKKSTNYKMVPPLKRSLADSFNSSHHEIQWQIPENDYHNSFVNNNHLPNYNITKYLEHVAEEEQLFRNLENAQDSKTGAVNQEDQELKEKLEKITNAYNQLRNIHEELFEEHTKLLNIKDQ